MGKGKQKGEVVSNASIVKFDGENELIFFQERYCMKEEHYEAAQGGSSGAKYFCAQRLLTIEDKVRVKWADHLTEKCLPKDQVKDLPPSSRSMSNARNFVELTQIFQRMTTNDTGLDDGICLSLPFSIFDDFITFLELNKNG